MGAKAGIVGAVMLLWAGGALAAEGLYPVRLTPILGLASVDAAAIDARLSGPLWPNSPDEQGLKLYKVRPGYWRLGKTFEEAVIDNALATSCTELKALTEAGYVGRYRNDRGIQRRSLMECEAIEMLRSARPAGENHVLGFVLNADAVDVLPPMVDNSVRFDRLCEEYIANKNSVAWSEFDRIIEVEVRSEYQIHVLAEHHALDPGQDIEQPVLDPGQDIEITSGGFTVVWLLAAGDLTGDGVADLLIESISSWADWIGPERKLSVARDTLGALYVLTRNAPGAVLRVIDAERYLTSRDVDFTSCGQH